MKRLFLLFSILFLTYLFIVFIFPFSPTSISDNVGNGNMFTSSNIKIDQLKYDSGQYCFALNNNKSFNAKNYFIPLFKDIDYQLSIKSKLNSQDTNAILNFYLNDHFLTSVQISNVFWTSYNKTFKVKEDIYGFGRDVPKFTIKCLCSKSNLISIATYNISCEPFYKRCIRLLSSTNAKVDNDNKTNLVYQTEIFKNTDFKDGFKYWKTEGSVCLTNINSNVYACISHDGNQKARFYQTINAISGQIYRLSFDLFSNTKGAFIICRSHIGGLEKYFWCKKPVGHRHYCWEFVCSKSGKNTIYFTCDNKGEFFYSNVSLELLNSNKRIFCESIVVLGLIIVLLSFIFLLKSRYIN